MLAITRGSYNCVRRHFATVLTLFYGQSLHRLCRDEGPYTPLQDCVLFQKLLCHVVDCCGADATLCGVVPLAYIWIYDHDAQLSKAASDNCCLLIYIHFPL